VEMEVKLHMGTPVHGRRFGSVLNYECMISYLSGSICFSAQIGSVLYDGFEHSFGSRLGGPSAESCRGFGVR
jgi:hypothetical protein